MFNGLNSHINTSNKQKIAYAMFAHAAFVGSKKFFRILDAGMIHIVPPEVREWCIQTNGQCRIGDKGVRRQIHRPVIASKNKLALQAKSANAVHQGSGAKGERVGPNAVGASRLRIKQGGGGVSRRGKVVDFFNDDFNTQRFGVSAGFIGQCALSKRAWPTQVSQFNIVTSRSGFNIVPIGDGVIKECAKLIGIDGA